MTVIQGGRIEILATLSKYFAHRRASESAEEGGNGSDGYDLFVLFLPLVSLVTVFLRSTEPFIGEKRGWENSRPALPRAFTKPYAATCATAS